MEDLTVKKFYYTLIASHRIGKKTFRRSIARKLNFNGKDIAMATSLKAADLKVSGLKMAMK